MMNIAHRGFSSRYPENTILSFRKALDLGVSRLELDLQVTRDGDLVVLHDRTVDRTTDNSGATTDFTLEEIRALDAGSWLSDEFAGNRIPTFLEVLTELPSAILVTELKFEGNAAIEDVLKLVRDQGATERVIISSFDHAKLPVVKSIAPELPVTALTKADGRTSREWVEWALSQEIDTLGPRCVEITQDYVNTVHDAGLLVRAWGLGRDQGEEMTRLIELGVDGMTTDCPDILQKIVVSRGMV
jgi:glycerophosphoryl diester phosphodiesterase